mmetsp:Transcript_34274/g.69130  ORF Transcript_34274/g.69130 Transcript_34274/m.69130 type:complete len:568 (-) Transcript_34274:108-1811(-)
MQQQQQQQQNMLSSPLHNPFVPPSPRFKFSCALNLITTELSAEDATTASHYAHYAKLAHETQNRRYGGDDECERCEYECRRIIGTHVPDLVEEADDSGRGLHDVNKYGQGRGLLRRQNGRRRSVIMPLAVLATIAVLAFSGWTYASNQRGNSAHGGGGGDISSATASDWNADDFATVTPTAYPTTGTTSEPTPGSSVDEAAAAAPVSAPASAPTTSSDEFGGSYGSSVEPFIATMRNNPWVMGAIAASFVLTIGAIVWVIRRNGKGPLIDAKEVEPSKDAGAGDGENYQGQVAVAVHSMEDVHEEDENHNTDEQGGRSNEVSRVPSRAASAGTSIGDNIARNSVAGSVHGATHTGGRYSPSPSAAAGGRYSPPQPRPTLSTCTSSTAPTANTFAASAVSAQDSSARPSPSVARPPRPSKSMVPSTPAGSTVTTSAASTSTASTAALAAAADAALAAAAAVDATYASQAPTRPTPRTFAAAQDSTLTSPAPPIPAPATNVRVDATPAAAAAVDTTYTSPAPTLPRSTPRTYAAAQDSTLTSPPHPISASATDARVDEFGRPLPPLQLH